MLELIRAGGWPMIPLLLLSAVALAIIVERFWSLRRIRVMPPGLGDEVHINDTVVTSDVAIVQGTSDAADAGGSIATIGDVGDVVAGGHVSIYQNGGGNQVVLGGPSSSFAANYLDVWTGGLGGGFVTAQNTTVVWGSWFGLDFVIDGGGEGNTYYDAGDNSGVSASDNYNDV